MNNNKMLGVQEAVEDAAERASGALPAGVKHRFLLFSAADRLLSFLVAIAFFGLTVVTLFGGSSQQRGLFSPISIEKFLIGGVVAGMTMFLALRSPGSLQSRSILASGEMVMACLIVHVTGGQVWALLLSFASLAMLSVYRDWRVFIPAAAILSVDSALSLLIVARSGDAWPSVSYVAGSVALGAVLIGYYKTEEKRSNEDSRQEFERLARELLYKEIVDTLAQGFVVFDRKTRKVVEASEGFLELAGLDAGKAANAKIDDLFTAGSDILNGDERGRSLETAVRRRSGPDVEVEAAIVPMPRSGNGLVTAVVRDISERKRNERKLVESEALLRGVMDQVDEVVYVMNAQTMEFTYVSPALEKLTGYSRNDIREMGGWRKFLPSVFSGGKPLKKAQDLDAMLTGQLDKIAGRNGTWWLCKDGSKKCLEDEWRHVYEGNKIVRTYGVLRDITARKKAEEDLAGARDLLDALMDSIPDTIYIKDRNRRYTRINKALGDVFGLAGVGDAVGKTDDAFHFAAVEGQSADEGRILKTGESVIGKLEEVKTAGGATRWMLASRVPIKDKRGDITGIVGVSRDITDRKLTEELLEQGLATFLSVVSTVSDGDLTIRGFESSDTLGRIAGSVNRMLDNFTAMLTRVKHIGLSVSSSATQILAASAEMAVGAQRQADEITNTSSAVEEMAASMSQVSRNAEGTAEAARRALDMAERGERCVRDTSEAMIRIDASVASTADKMKGLANRSREIEEIIDLIDEIASQTNLLALNAAIEAAHAGEAGVGFSVVADEIRKLAERSAKATRDVGGLIKGIQMETEGALAAMSKGLVEVKGGSSLAEEARQALEDISRVVRQSAELIEEITAASEEQARVTRNVAGAMQTVSTITLETSAGAHETAQTIQGMVELSDQLNQAISRFRVKDDHNRTFLFDDGERISGVDDAGRRPRDNRETN